MDNGASPCDGILLLYFLCGHEDFQTLHVRNERNSSGVCDMTCNFNITFSAVREVCDTCGPANMYNGDRISQQELQNLRLYYLDRITDPETIAWYSREMNRILAEEEFEQELAKEEARENQRLAEAQAQNLRRWRRRRWETELLMHRSEQVRTGVPLADRDFFLGFDDAMIYRTVTLADLDPIEECSICRMPWEEADASLVICELPCRHRFHRQELDDYFTFGGNGANNNHHRCPYCRRRNLFWPMPDFNDETLPI